MKNNNLTCVTLLSILLIFIAVSSLHLISKKILIKNKNTHLIYVKLNQL